MNTKEEILRKSRERMQQAGDLHELIIQEFERRLNLLASGYTGKIPWNEVTNPDSSDLIESSGLPEPSPEAAAADLARLVIIRLNGGLGTSMGLSKAKSLIPVKDGHNFLYFMKEQILHLRRRYKTFIPLIFMNSFNTQSDTLAEKGIPELNDNPAGNSLPPDFLQSRIPRIQASDLLPAGDGTSGDDWCPPGHGDIFLSLKITGILDRLLEAGFTTAFISNSDNLAATVHPGILHYMHSEDIDFAMEITPKTLADIKGGALARRTHEGRSRVELIEAAQVEDADLKEFQDIRKFAYFNTNNLWVNLKSLKKALESPEGLPLPVIVNPKKNDAGTDVIQLETAMGAAIGCFDKSKGIIIPRSRFAPVKTCADLLVRRSDAYTVNEDATLSLNQTFIKDEPVVRLSSDYKKITDFENLFRVTPSLAGCSELNVEGPVIFDAPVVIEGSVTLINESKTPVSVTKTAKSVFKDETIRI